MTSDADSGDAAEGDWERTLDRCPIEQAGAKVTYPVEKAAVRCAIAALHRRTP